MWPGPPPAQVSEQVSSPSPHSQMLQTYRQQIDTEMHHFPEFWLVAWKTTLFQKPENQFLLGSLEMHAPPSKG